MYYSTQDFFAKALKNPGYILGYVKQAKRVLSEANFNVVWVRSPSVGSLLFAVVALRQNCCVIHHMCANAMETWKDKKYSSLEKVAGFFTSLLIGRAIAYICRHPNSINLTTGSELESISRRYSPSRTYQFVDMLVSGPASSTRTHQDDKIVKVAFVGRIVRDKGIFELVDVVAQCPQTSLIVVGGGPDLEELTRYSAQLPHGKIKLLGQLPHSELGEVFLTADAVCVPSNNFYEGFPRVIMEAWSYGRAVIVSDVGGIRAFVRDGVNGIIVEPGDRVQLLQALNMIASDDLRSKLEEGARAMAPKSTVEYWSGRVKEILNVS